MATDSNTSDYLYTGDEYPDRTGGTLVSEASRLALDSPVNTIGDKLDITFELNDPTPTYTLDFSFDTEVENTINPAHLPIMSDFKMRLVRIINEESGTTLRYIGDDRQRPLSLISGTFSVTTLSANEGPETSYGRDRSPEPIDDPHDVARAFGPNHEVRVSDPQWNLDSEAIDKVRQQL